MGAHPVDVTRDPVTHDVWVGRQAVYDADRRLASYQIIFRDVSGSRDVSGVADEGPEGGEQATSRLIATTFTTFGLDSISDGKPVFIGLTRGFLTGMLPIPVTPDNVIIEVTGQITVDHELLLGLAELKREGFRLAVDDYRGDLGRVALLELADFVKIDVDSLPTPVVPGLVQACRLTGATLLASNVQDASSLQRSINLGFELFQGEYLNRPVVLQQRVLSPSQLICVRLLNDLADLEAPLQRIEQLVGSDPGLSMRLLRSANSAAGSGRVVESLRQALVLVGPRRLRSWVVLTLLEGTATQNTTDELWSVLARAHACQRLAADQADLAYTVGLLSGAARLLGSDPETVADTSGIGPDARVALVAGEGPAGQALTAVLAHEREDDDGVLSTGFSVGEVSRFYLEALHESLQLVHQFLGR
jgi:EAL and modified HD-GYP domain-containing signal transduction protein